MAKHKVLLRWFGGKYYMLNDILPFLKIKHKHYVEVFGGGAVILLNKKPSLMETYNDINSGLVSLFRVIRNKDMFMEFKRLVELTPYSRQEFNLYRNTWQKESDLVKKAYQFFYISSCSFGGIGKKTPSFGSVITSPGNMMCSTTQAYLSRIKNLSNIHKRLMPVQIENQSFEKILERYDTENTLFYIDPPYPHETRRSGIYQHEMTDKQHIILVDMLLNIKGKAIVSTYSNKIYNKLIKNGWGQKQFVKSCYSSSYGRTMKTKHKKDMSEKNKRIEQLILSPHFKVSNQISIKSYLKFNKKKHKKIKL